MECQRCNKKESTVHLTKIVNGEKNEIYLCEDCARETNQMPFGANNPFSFQNLLSGLLTPETNNPFMQQDLKCDTCGLNYKDFTKKGLLGCTDCYGAFNSKLEPLLKRIHGSIKHNGKVPKRRGGVLRVKREIEELRKELKQEIAKENFEKAAELRDRIYEMENKMGGE